MAAVKDWEKGINDFIKEVQTEIVDTVAVIVNDTYTELVQRSPVWSGTYMSSHRIGINREATARVHQLPDLEPGETPASRLSVAHSNADMYLKRRLNDIRKKKILNPLLS